MLRIHFTRADLVRTRLADGPDPLWESVLSLQMLRARYSAAIFDGWRRRVRGALHDAGQAGLVRRLLFPLTPDASYFPDFLTPPEGLLGLTDGIAAIRATSPRRLRREIRRLCVPHRSPPSWAKSLSAAEPDTLAELGAALTGYHRTALGAHWDRMKTGAEIDLARRSRQRRAAGTAHMLAGFAPMMRWRAPILEVPYPVKLDLHLDGRGLLLIPSYFCWYHPVALADPALPPTLVYPLRPTADFLDHSPVVAADAALARLLGPTRARMLATVAAQGVTTSELARRTGISVGTASQHATVLRESGLVNSDRRANVVIHTITSLGAALLGPRRP
jgi:DNA-binding transcriptional ArsR family regulator